MQHLKILLFVLSIAIVFATKAVAQVDITYNPENGNLSVNSPERTITTFEAISAEDLFIPGNVLPGVIVHPFGMITPAKLFKLSLGPVGKVNGAYNSIDFGNILPARLPNQQLAADLTIAGTLTPDGSGNNALDANGINLSWLPRFQPVSVNYQTANGNLTVESPDRPITAFEMISTGSNLNPAGAAPGTFDSPPDILNETRLYKFSEGDAAYNSINFGNVVKPGMSYPEFVADMAFDGAFTPDAPGDTNTALNAHGLNVNWIPGPQPAGPGVTVSYDPPTGNLSVNSPDRTITTFQTISAGNQFIPENATPGTVAPPFDIITPEKLFKLSAGANAYNSIDFGNVLPTGLLNSQLEADLSIDGSLTPDGSGNNRLDANGLSLSWQLSPVNVTYNAADGNLTIESPSRSITAFEMLSAGSMLNPTGAAPGMFNSPADVLSENRLFKLSEGASAYNSINFGNVVEPGLLYQQFAADMNIGGSLAPDGSGNNAIDANGLKITRIADPNVPQLPVEIIYNSATGSLVVESPTRPITTFGMTSAGLNINPRGARPGLFNSPNDVINIGRLFKWSEGADAYNSINFGNIVKPQLSRDQFVADMTIHGSLAPDRTGNHALDTNGLNIQWIPAPSAPVKISYTSRTGNLTVSSPDRAITAFEMTSAGSNFNPAGAIPGLFDTASDILSENRLLKFSEGAAAYNSLNFGDVVQSGLTRGEFVADMTIDGTLTANGSGQDSFITNGLHIDWQSGAIPGGGPVHIIYDPSNGNLSVNSPSRTITTLEIKSDSGLLIPENVVPGVLVPPFDLIRPSKLFKLSAGANAYNYINFGNILPAGRSCDSLFSDLTIMGSLTPDGSGNNSLDAGGLNVCLFIPEPSGIVLLSLGFLTLLGFARRQGNPTR